MFQLISVSVLMLFPLLGVFLVLVWRMGTNCLLLYTLMGAAFLGILPKLNAQDGKFTYM